MSEGNQSFEACPECFAVVRSENMRDHVAWHEKVIEQAVAASKKKSDEEFLRALRTSF